MVIVMSGINRDIRAAAAVAIESRGAIRGSDRRGKSHGALQGRGFELQ